MLRRSGLVLGALLILAGASFAVAGPLLWPTPDDTPGPGGFATIVLETPKHGSRVQGPDVEIRLRTDNVRAAVRVRLDGKYVDIDGRPHQALTDNPHDYPQWSFRDTPDGQLVVPAKGLAPGLHTLEIIQGAFGTELPNANEQRISFLVE